MYLDHFNLTERPFSITPDPRFLYMSVRHREALAHLLYGLGEGGGFVQLTGEVGTGKTTVCRCLLEQVPDNVDIALVLNPKVTAIELIATVCDELGIAYPGEHVSIKTLTDALNVYLLDAYANDRSTVLIIDEAQNLGADVLEQIRLLTNLETSTRKLLQIILIGQPELRALLAREDMRQLSQRVTARYHLEPISRDEADAYIKHRLQICGTTKTIFKKRAVDRIQKLSGGIPRLINVLCDRAMLGAYVESKIEVDTRVVDKAACEVLAEERGETGGRHWSVSVAGGLVVLLSIAFLVVYQPWKRIETVTVIPDVASSSVAAPSDPREPVNPVVEQTVVVEVGSDVVETPALTALLQATDSNNYRAAWAELLALWAVDLPETVKPDFCDFTRQYGLLCQQVKGSWNTLRQLDRPVILALYAPDGRRVPVVMQYLDDSTAEIIIGHELYRQSIAQVELYWYGEYTFLFQAPPGGHLSLKVGDRDPVVSWLRQQFETVQGVAIPTTDALYFDYALQKQVLAFQRSEGLVADGIVGKNTMIRLNTESGREGVPRLSAGAS